MNYTISEHNSLNEAVICVLINRGLLEKNVMVNLIITDETTEGIYTLNSTSIFILFSVHPSLWKTIKSLS